jgi:hypothetical protein
MHRANMFASARPAPPALHSARRRARCVAWNHSGRAAQVARQSVKRRRGSVLASSRACQQPGRPATRGAWRRRTAALRWSHALSYLAASGMSGGGTAAAGAVLGVRRLTRTPSRASCRRHARRALHRCILAGAGAAGSCARCAARGGCAAARRHGCARQPPPLRWPAAAARALRDLAARCDGLHGSCAHLPRAAQRRRRPHTRRWRSVGRGLRALACCRRTAAPRSACRRATHRRRVCAQAAVPDAA